MLATTQSFGSMKSQILQMHETLTPSVFSGRSQLWQIALSVRPNFPDEIDNLLHHESGLCHGLGVPPCNDAEYQERHDRFVSRYREYVTPEDVLSMPEPDIGNPTKLPYGDASVSSLYLSTLSYAMAIKGLWERHRTGQARVLEIGAGFGGVAEILIREGLASSYTNIDIAENLLLAAWYLSACHPDRSFNIGTDAANLRFMLPDHAPEIDGQFDLIINTRSLAEMPRETARAYVSFIAKHLAPNGIFLTVNGVRRTKDGVRKYADYGFECFNVIGIYPAPRLSQVNVDQCGMFAFTNDPSAPLLPHGLLDRIDPFFWIGIREEIDQCFGDVSGDLETSMIALEDTLSSHKKAAMQFIVTGNSERMKRYPVYGSSPVARAICSIASGEGDDRLPPHLQDDLGSFSTSAMRKILRRNIDVPLSKAILEHLSP